MASDMFIKLDDIKGESIDDKHKGEIDVISWSWGVTQTGTTQGGGIGTGKANVQDLTFTKQLCKASPLLFQMCCAGKHINQVLLTCRKAGGNPLEYLKITLNQAFVTSVTPSGDKNSDSITETVTLTFSSMNYEYVPQKPDGSGDASVVKGFDVGRNKLV
jgi:type VI secretion system secreted protein Hcp